MIDGSKMIIKFHAFLDEANNIQNWKVNVDLRLGILKQFLHKMLEKFQLSYFVMHYLEELYCDESATVTIYSQNENIMNTQDVEEKFEIYKVSDLLTKIFMN